MTKVGDQFRFMEFLDRGERYADRSVYDALQREAVTRRCRFGNVYADYRLFRGRKVLVAHATVIEIVDPEESGEP